MGKVCVNNQAVSMTVWIFTLVLALFSLHCHSAVSNGVSGDSSLGVWKLAIQNVQHFVLEDFISR